MEDCIAASTPYFTHFVFTVLISLVEVTNKSPMYMTSLLFPRWMAQVPHLPSITHCSYRQGAKRFKFVEMWVATYLPMTTIRLPDLAQNVCRNT